MASKDIVVSHNSQEIIVEDASEAKDELSVDVKLLSADDLQVFLRRKGAVEQAQLNSQMMIEGYNAWAVGLRARYSIEGSFSVDTRTGQILKMEEVAPEETDG
jgi:hypothetical protein